MLPTAYLRLDVPVLLAEPAEVSRVMEELKGRADDCLAKKRDPRPVKLPEGWAVRWMDERVGNGILPRMLPLDDSVTTTMPPNTPR